MKVHLSDGEDGSTVYQIFIIFDGWVGPAPHTGLCVDDKARDKANMMNSEGGSRGITGLFFYVHFFFVGIFKADLPNCQCRLANRSSPNSFDENMRIRELCTFIVYYGSIFINHCLCLFLNKIFLNDF